MKTLAVIKNELFQDYLRFVSTNDLPGVLDNPDIPVPFTCVESVDNSNSDILMEQLKSYFNRSKVNNKDFYTLDEDTFTQLQFMFNLIKLSSGQVATPIASTPANNVVTKPVIAEIQSPVTQVSVAPVKHSPVDSTPVEVQPSVITDITEPVVQEPEIVVATVLPTEVIADALSVEDDDPFGFNATKTDVKVEKTSIINPVIESTPVMEIQPAIEPVVEVQPVVIEDPVIAEKVVKEPEILVPDFVPPTVQMITSLGIPQGATIKFLKDESLTAILLDEKTVSYEGQNMTLVEAAKSAFKKSGTVGMAVGLSNWNFEGETLKAWKEKQLN